MAITISGENNNDKILASDGVIDEISGINIVGLLTAGHLKVGSNIQLGNAGIVTATTFVGNLTGNVNSTSPLLLQTGGSERFRITGDNALGIAGANYGSSGQVLTSGGSGSAVTWATLAVTGFTNGSDNRVVTATSGSGLNGEANLTFNGSTLAATGAITATGTIETTGSELKITGAEPRLTFTDTDNNPDFQIWANAQRFSIYDSTNSATRLRINSGGEVLIGTETGTGNNLTVQDAGTSTTAGGNIVARFQSNGSGRDASIQLSDNVAHSALISMVSSNFAINLSGNERLRIKSDGVLLLPTTGKLSVGVTNPSGRFSVGPANGSRVIEIEEYGVIRGYNRNSSAWAQIDFEASSYSFDCGGTEKFHIDSSGRVLINKNTNRQNYFNGGYTGQLQVEGTNDSTRLTQFIHNSSGSDGHILVIGKSRGTSVGSYTAVQDNDYLGTISFQGADGDEMVDGARVESRVNGTPGNDDMHADLIFRTNHGIATPRERLRITAKGKLLERQDSYSETYQANNWGNAFYVRGGWMRFNSNFSNPTKDLVILADGGNANNNMFIKVTVTQLDYPGTDQGLGSIHIGYASAKRAGDSSGKWYVQNGNMALESGSNFHGNYSNVGTLNWQNGNTSDTNTLRYISNRATNYDTYDVQVEVWENGNCSYYLHSDFVT